MARRSWFPPLFTVAVALPLPLIWSLVYLAPFGSPFGADMPPATILPVATAALLMAALAASALDAQDRATLGRRLALFAAAALVAPVACGAALHPDFYSAVFMIIVQSLCILLYRAELFYGDRAYSAARSGFYYFGLAASIVFSAWLCLMGYTLVTRTEPRWGESLAYNVYNAVLAAGLFFCTVRTLGNAKRSVRAANGSFLVDGLDFGPVIGPVACELAGILFSMQSKATCDELRGRLHGEPCSCDFADRPGFCADYSAMYNAILKVRRLVEALRLGTIENSEERNPGKRATWRFVPAEGVEVSDARKGTP